MSRSGKHKVAVALDPEGRISGHFRISPRFLVVTFDRGKAAGEEVRENPYADEEEREGSDALCWKIMEEILPDVRTVICGGMGESAFAGMLRRDVLPLLTSQKDAKKALDAYLRGRLRHEEGLIHGPRDFPDLSEAESPHPGTRTIRIYASERREG